MTRLMYIDDVGGTGVAVFVLAYLLVVDALVEHT